MSLFSVTSNKTAQAPKQRRRSSSESRSGRAAGRSPIISFEESSDVATAVCTEISRLMMLNPDMKTGTFLNAMSNSQMDINKSDATIIISAAILGHIGNEKMRDRLLSKSKTCARMYSEMGLEKPKLCEMFVIMHFAMNPTFCTLLSHAISVSLTRAQTFISEEVDKKKMANTANSMVRDGSWSNEEALSIFIPKSLEAAPSLAGDLSFSKTPTSLIHPNDSISSVGDIPDYRKRINTKDLMSYVVRKKKGNEPAFSEVFRSESIPRPPLSNQNVNRRGVGYIPNEAERAGDTIQSKINNILGAQTTVSYNLNTGRGRTRRPRVEDYIDSESVATTTLRSPPSAVNNPWDNHSFKVPNPPSPTEINLPDSVVYEPEIPIMREVDSYEELKARLNN